MAKTVDEKLLFPAYDTTPSFMGWRNFRRNALTHGGSYTDDDGWSYWGKNPPLEPATFTTKLRSYPKHAKGAH